MLWLTQEPKDAVTLLHQVILGYKVRRKEGLENYEASTALKGHHHS